MTASESASRQKSESSPTQLGRRGWKRVLVRVKDDVGEDHLSIVAAGVAFYALLSIVPALSAVISLYGLVADPATVQQHVNALGGVIPESAQQFLNAQLSEIAAGPGASLGIGFLASLVVLLWSANKGMKAMIEALNIAYGEKEERGIIKKNGLSLLMTTATIVGAVVALVLIVALPALLGRLGLGSWAATLVSLARWPLLFAVMLLGLAVIYRFGPHRKTPHWRWVSPGALVATGLWLVVSALFSWYVSNFGNYNETFGSAGAVVILLMWFFVSSFVILLGAELNAEIEGRAEEPESAAATPAHRRGGGAPRPAEA